MIFSFDPPKRDENLRKHGIDLADIAAEFTFDDAAIIPSYKGRFVAVAAFRGRATAVVFKPLGTEGLSLISARPASRKERMLYA